jgi:predicted DNA-binding transcriptional regulator AlpA
LETPTVAGQLRVKEVTLEKWRQTGCGPAYIKIGRLVRYRQSDLDRWLRDQTVTGDAA